jgi:hypothetical protein
MSTDHENEIVDWGFNPTVQRRGTGNEAIGLSRMVEHREQTHRATWFAS